ncbi:RluA family pseudouridine synthase [Wenyingzhuangia marina]|uniref:23S rRNA pseudouridine1911/1915/1917 synthase n=1 Tax=Wenyingzhuangia marina TaxID=1195760 RepID=A0A1M5WRH0_9FLAO|nr:RluA family pseudouridine synthase [Wenyingzhuangia marina]GGF79890.1 pseudouridine synthase [Wenyingzhuangia marina]SHH89613.1 23S rRNA pseudouridine1911/1915/1917 synthase [Wenyingzhuangia marina]
MKITETHTSPNLPYGIRLSDYAVGIFASIPSKAGIKKAIKKGLILVNNQRGVSGQFIVGGEKIELLEDENLIKKNIDLALEVLWEDDYLAVIYKPAGLLVSGNKAKTVTNALPFNLKPSTQENAVKPQPVHRLDFATSGLLLIGKTADSIRELGKLFENKTIQKTYEAVTIGKMKNQGTINFPIDGKESLSSYLLLKTVNSERFEKLNLVQLTPHTGRRHQLRIHCAHIGNPILGDVEHGIEEKILKGKGLFLHAKSLEFTHPYTQEKLVIQKETPAKFNRLFI